MIVGPVERRSVAEAVYQQLRDRIVDGEYAPGAQLPSERTIAHDAGVHRQSVREALQRLRQVGLVDVVHGDGSFVHDWRRTADLSLLPEIVVDASGRLRPEPAAALIRLRATVGIEMVRLAAVRSTHDDRVLLRQRMQRAEYLHDGAELMAGEVVLAFEDIWAAIASASHNAAFRLAYRTLRDASLQFVRVFPPRLVPTRNTLETYAAMVDAILIGDADLAERRARGVLVDVERTLASLMAAADRTRSPQTS